MSAEQDKIIKKLSKDVQDLKVMVLRQNRCITNMDKEIRRLKHQSVGTKNDIAAMRRT
jgi:adenine specific DNA methylase Mod